MVIVAGLVGSGFYGWARWQDERFASEREPWFDAYVDVTATPSYAFESLGSGGQRNVVLAFIVASRGNACTPAWGGVYGLDEAESNLDLDRRLARFRMLGGSAMVSFGGQANSDLALTCNSDSALAEGYGSVVDRYELGSIDMDVEGELLTDERAVQRQAAAIAEVQNGRKADGGLDVWLTLPVAPDGLTFEGLRTVRAYLAAGVDLAGVNAMTMNYNSGSAGLGATVRDSLSAVQGQLRALYQEVGASIGDATAWSRVSATVMIGQNDVRNEVFGLADAKDLARFAADRGMVRMSMWSLNRDRQCDANWPDPKRVSDSCSGVAQKTGEFAATLRAQRPGSIVQFAETTPRNPAGTLEDDPKTSPYPIWSSDASYPADSKVVWRRSVYEAKWWTQGDQPDQTTESGAQPWRLLGPVLPGEKPVERPRLPADAYAAWQKAAEYRRGDRVLFDGSGYEAKWWTQGDSPDAALVRPEESPWRSLTDEEVAAVIAGGKDGKGGKGAEG
ncbi:glycosyl hydrolase family 18 [Leucobacter sp. wl10]|nr:glycosyl hydrolase family 18 [Leucobacter sp. wl10]